VYKLTLEDTLHKKAKVSRVFYPGIFVKSKSRVKIHFAQDLKSGRIKLMLRSVVITGVLGRLSCYPCHNDPEGNTLAATEFVRLLENTAKQSNGKQRIGSTWVQQ